jgi:hypothetical protein
MQAPSDLDQLETSGQMKLHVLDTQTGNNL